MTTKSQLENDLKEAMRANDDLRKRTLRLALSAIKLAEIEKGAALEDSAILATLQKEIKSREEAIADAERANRPDLIAASQAEMGVLQAYLPKQLSEAELEGLAKEAISEAGATSIKEMGQVMKLLVPRLEGRATGELASQMVRKLLA